MRTFRVGTRDSLLAMTQTKQVVEELVAATGAQFEIVSMKTSGDLDTSKPLWQMDGKNFFTKELDQSLLDGHIDCMVSSYKDIGGERPEGIIPACVTKRIYPHDILLIKKETVSNLSKLKLLRVGTSSPRRIYNTTKYLSDYLPKHQLGITCCSLRGNVNTRIQKLRDGHFDAIILAMAGLERLARDPEASEVLRPLLEGLTFMVLPETKFPSAPAQGSLLLECRQDDEEMLEVLKKIHSPQTAKEVAREREHFQSFGGGCHLALGVYSKDIADGELLVQRGELDGKKIDSLEFLGHGEKKAIGKKAFIGLPLSKHEEDHSFIYDGMIAKESFDEVDLSAYQSLFLTSSYGIDYLERAIYRGDLWVSGYKTFKLAASKGFWVNGSADSMGDDILGWLLNSSALKMMRSPSVTGVLTSSTSSSDIGEVIPCYRRSAKHLDEDLFKELHAVEVFYWSSAYQFEEYLKRFPDIIWDKVLHCCGLGKTYTQLKLKGVTPVPFVTIDSFRQWFINRE